MAMVHLKPLDATNQILHCLEKFWMFIFPVYVVLQCKQTFSYYAEIFLNRANLNALVSFDLDDTIMSTNTIASCCWRRRQCLSKKYLLYTTKICITLCKEHILEQNTKSLFFRSISLSLELCTRCVSMSYAFITCFDSVIQKSVQVGKKPHKQLNILLCVAIEKRTTATATATTKQHCRLFDTHSLFCKRCHCFPRHST